MANVTSLWRHPIKSHGREALAFVDLVAGQSMPWDRHWAVTHAATKFSVQNPSWVMCRNFMIGALTPELAGIWASLDSETGKITLRHEAIGELTFHPDNESDVARFIAWITPICPPEKSQPTNIVSLPHRGHTDSDYPSISIMSIASHHQVEQQLGHTLAQERWRGNIWVDGIAPWSEWDWIGREITIGTTVLRVKEPIKRCMHTAANPISGKRDVDTLGILRDNWDHQNFGIYAEVIQGGKISLGDTAEVI
ncbi:MAG: MOSC domain-containing protein [Octadecabacter sp.]